MSQHIGRATSAFATRSDSDRHDRSFDSAFGARPRPPDCALIRAVTYVRTGCLAFAAQWRSPSHRALAEPTLLPCVGDCRLITT
ncbi:MAG: hypothetical protein QOE89_4189 [Pseudonocardiales bacterium]|nr:hypothetical protein [Pseudonocardiales bacterium]